MYLPSRGSHLTIWLPGSKHENVISDTVFCSWCALSAEMSGAKLATGKWMRGKLPCFVSKACASLNYVRTERGWSGTR